MYLPVPGLEHTFSEFLDKKSGQPCAKFLNP